MAKACKFEVKLTAKDLWKFSMYHSNRGYMGIFNGIFTVVALFLLMARWDVLGTFNRGLLIVCVLLFTVWQPLLLWFKACKQVKKPSVCEAMALTFTDEGLTVEQQGQEVRVTWDQMGRMDRLPSMIVLYMDRIHAYVIPKAAMGEQMEDLCQLARTHLPGERRRKI